MFKEAAVIHSVKHQVSIQMEQLHNHMKQQLHTGVNSNGAVSQSHRELVVHSTEHMLHIQVHTHMNQMYTHIEQVHTHMEQGMHIEFKWSCFTVT